jgi:hypothetical protein
MINQIVLNKIYKYYNNLISTRPTQTFTVEIQKMIRNKAFKGIRLEYV